MLKMCQIFRACMVRCKQTSPPKILLDDNNIELFHLLYALKFKLDIEHKIYTKKCDYMFGIEGV